MTYIWKKCGKGGSKEGERDEWESKWEGRVWDEVGGREERREGRREGRQRSILQPALALLITSSAAFDGMFARFNHAAATVTPYHRLSHPRGPLSLLPLPSSPLWLASEEWHQAASCYERLVPRVTKRKVVMAGWNSDSAIWSEWMRQWMKVSIHAFVLSRDKKDRESERKKKRMRTHHPACYSCRRSFQG